MSILRARPCRAFWVLAMAVQLAACSGLGGGPADGPGTRIDPDSIPPVEPRAEPKSRYGNPKSYVVHGRRYETRDDATGYVAEGIASWYGSKFHGRRTSSGETYDMYALTAAHRSIPLPTYVRVTNLDNGRETVVRVNDRGPFHENRIIDLSYGAALKLGFADSGTARVRVRALSPGGGEASSQSASAESDARPEPTSSEVFIQVGAFTHLVNAQHLRARVHGLEIRPVEVSRGEDSGGERVYRVRVGPLAAGEQARVLSELEGAGIRSVRVLRE